MQEFLINTGQAKALYLCTYALFFLLCLQPVSIPLTPQRNFLMCLSCILMSSTVLTKCATGVSVYLFLTYGNISLCISFFFPLSTMLSPFAHIALCMVLSCWAINTVRCVSTRALKAMDSQPVISLSPSSFPSSATCLHIWPVCIWPNIISTVPSEYDNSLSPFITF